MHKYYNLEDKKHVSRKCQNKHILSIKHSNVISLDTL